MNFNASEHLSWIINNSTSHNSLLVAEFEVDLDLDRLSKAIENLISTTPLLQLSISTKNAFFVESLRLKNNLIQENINWEGLSEKYLNSNFHDNEPLIHFILTTNRNNNVLLILAHHVICDGFTILEIGRKFFDLYYRRNKNSPNLIPHKVPKIEINTTVSGSSVFSSRTSLEFFSCNANLMSVINNTCRESNLNMVSFLSAVFALGMKVTFSLEKLNVLLPVNLRNRKTYEKLGFYTSHIEMILELDGYLNPTELSRKIENLKFNRLRKRTYLEKLDALKNEILKRDSDKNFMEEFKSKMPTMFLSYLNEHNPISCMDFSEINKVHLAVSADAYMGTKDSLTIQIVNYKNSLYVSVNYPTNFISKAKILKFIENVKIILEFK